MVHDKSDLLDAMQAAEEAFRECFDEKQIDAAYYDLELRGFVLSEHDFKPLERVTFDATFKAEELGREPEDE